MEGMVALIVYLVILMAQIALLVYNILRPHILLWGILLGWEALSAVVAGGLMQYYDSLPGYGFMPGLSYFGEVLFSMGAAIAYGVMLGISAASAFVCQMVRVRHKKQ